jgi:hypothetical protein
VAAADLRSGVGLIGLLLVYAMVVDRLGRPPVRQLLVSLGNFGALSFYSMLLAASAFALLCTAMPGQRTQLETRAFWLLVAGLLTTLTFPFFAVFKELVLPARGFLWDRTFAHIGRSLFGQSPWTITHLYFGTVTGTRLLDWAYRSLLPLMFGLPFATAVLVTQPRLRLRILFTWTASWIVIGTLAGWFFASAGPCYYNRFVAYDPDYAELQRRLADVGRLALAQGHPIASLSYQSGLLLTYRAHDFAPGGGISAMPSMHVAMASLAAVAGWQYKHALGILGIYMAFAVWIATIHFGWHYFVDGPVGAAMMLSLWLVSKWPAAIAYPEGSTIAASAP